MSEQPVSRPPRHLPSLPGFPGLVGLLVRLVVPVAALATLALDDDSGVPGVLALLGLVLSAERLAQRRGTGFADRLLVTVGSVLVVLVLTGIALDLAGADLRTGSWVVAVAVLDVAGLAVAAVLPVRDGVTTVPADGITGTTLLKTLPWVSAAVLVTVVSVRLSATSLSASDAPPLQMSLGRVSGAQVQVIVSSTEAVGPLEIRTASDGNEVSYPLFELGADGTDTVTLALPRQGRYLISLNYPDQTQPLRTLVLDR